VIALAALAIVPKKATAAFLFFLAAHPGTVFSEESICGTARATIAALMNDATTRD